MKKLASTSLLILFLICFQSLHSQKVLIEKKIPGNKSGRAIIHCKDGGYVLIGESSDNSQGLADIFLIKLNEKGDSLWSLTHGGFNNDIAFDGLEMEDSSLMIMGWTGSFSKSPSRDVYLARFSKSGQLMWNNVYGGTGHDTGTQLERTNDGGFVISAHTESYGAGSTDAYLIRLDSNGDTLWTKTYGGPLYDDAWDVDVLEDGGFIITGGTYSFANGKHDDAWLIRTDANSDVLWRKTYGLKDRIDWAWAVTPLKEGGFALIGLNDADSTMQGQLPTGNLYFLKLDDQGNILWDRSIPSQYRLDGTDIHQTDDGGFLICGSQIMRSPPTSTFKIIKTDAQGIVKWERSFFKELNFSRAYKALICNDGNFAVIGYSDRTSASNSSLYFVLIEDSIRALSSPKISATVSLKIYPNPIRDQLQVSFDLPQQNILFKVFDAQGKLLLTKDYEVSSSIRIDLSHLPKAHYQLWIQTDEFIHQETLVKH